MSLTTAHCLRLLKSGFAFKIGLIFLKYKISIGVPQDPSFSDTFNYDSEIGLTRHSAAKAQQKIVEDNMIIDSTIA
jgi:hypothetical protein